MRICTKLAPLVVGLLTAFSASAANFTVLVGPNGENRYEPATLVIQAGDKVEFKWVSGVHPTASDASSPAWDVFIPSASVTKSFSNLAVGTYPYHCSAHGVAGPPSVGNMAGVITVVATTGLATATPASASLLNIFPNPSRGIVNVTLNERTKADYKLRLRNIIGQEVRTVALRPELSASQSLDLSDLPAGLYLYSLLVDNKAVLTKRLTLQ